MKKLLALTLASLLPLGACASDDPAGDADANTVDVLVQDFQFNPATVTIKVGQTVRWTWNGADTHNIVSGTECGTRTNPLFSGPPQQGGTYSFPFEVAGTYDYYCDPHCSMGMKGKVIVQ